jgi:serine phosphatase RsbU (regulator of sigma subunit)
VVRANRHLDAAALVQVLYQEVQRFSQNVPQLDDATAVVLKVLPGPAPA